MDILKKLMEIFNELIFKYFIKKYEELWIKIRDLIRSVTKKSDGHDEKYMRTNLMQMISYL